MAPIHVPNRSKCDSGRREKNAARTKPFSVCDQPKRSFIATAATEMFTRSLYAMTQPRKVSATRTWRLGYPPITAAAFASDCVDG